MKQGYSLLFHTKLHLWCQISGINSMCSSDIYSSLFKVPTIAAHFFRSMESVVKHSREVQEKVWNFTIVDISFLAFGISFPQISLATIDAIRNLANLYGGGLGHGTLVGSATFDLFPIHVVCFVVPKARESKKISDIGVWLVELFWSFWAYIWLYIILEVWTPNVITIWEALLAVLQYGLLLMHAYAQDKRWPYLSIPLERSDRPKEWVPIEVASSKLDNCDCYSNLQDAENSNGSVVDISVEINLNRTVNYTKSPTKYHPSTRRKTPNNKKLVVREITTNYYQSNPLHLTNHQLFLNWIIICKSIVLIFIWLLFLKLNNFGLNILGNFWITIMFFIVICYVDVGFELVGGYDSVLVGLPN
ncbi:hypothetical protein UlMin_015997 [Ulmus minor]